MRVAYFTESLYPHVDGVSRTLARLFATLERRGIEFRVYSPFVPDEATSWSERVTFAPYVRFPLYPDYRVSLPYTPAVRRALAGEAFDLVHLVSPTPMASWVQRLARSLRLPVVASFHTHFVSYFRHYGLAPLEPMGWAMLRRFYRGCARVYAPTESIAAELVSRGIDRVELWSRGVDLEAYSPGLRDPDLRVKAGADEQTPMLLLVSRLVREKDLADLISVDRILRERSARYRLVLVGDGPMREELRSALPAAYFAGHQEGDELARWYASADVFVFPSTTETLGNVVLEALASGLPAVVVDRGGPQDLVEHGRNGFVARANDPQDIASHVSRLLEDPHLRSRMAVEARATARPRDWEAINGELLASYERVVAEHRAFRPSLTGP